MLSARPDVEVIAHRGASAYVAEHTFAAFDLALAQGSHMLELDVRVTSDGEPVVLHDPTLLRTTGDLRAIGTVALAEIEELDAATRPPTLDAVLARYGTATRYLIELKDPRPEWEPRVIERVDRHGLRDRVVVQSFNAPSLRRLRRAAPWLPVAPLYEHAPRAGWRFERVARYAAGVSAWHGVIDAAFVAAAHFHGLAVRAWTVDDAAEIERLVALGVDGVITNVPDVAAVAAIAAAAAPAAAA